MAPRPSMGVPAPRAMPPYKYATGVRNPNPQVVQPALQQVREKNLSSSPSFLCDLLTDDQFLYWVSSVWFSCGLLQAQPAVHVQGQEPLTASMLAAAPPQEQKQMLGQLSQNNYKRMKSCTRVDVYVAYFLCVFPNRWASLPTDSVHACQLGGEDHRHAAGNRQLRVVAHVGVPWISALKGA